MEKSFEEWIESIETGAGRKLSKNENGFLEHLADLLGRLDWKDSLNASDLSILEPQILSVERDRHRPLTEGLWDSPPDDEYTLWQYIALVFDQRDLPIPAFLQAQTALEETRSQIDRKRKAKSIRLWRNRLGNLSQSRESGRAGDLDIRLKLHGKGFKWEQRLGTQAKFAPLAARELSVWLDKEFGFLDRFSPDSLPLCSLFQQYYRSTRRARLNLDQAEDASFVNELLHREDTRLKLVDKDGSPITISERRLRWEGSAEGPDAGGDYHLSLAFTDGESAPSPLIYLAGRNPLYMHGQSLFPGPALIQPEESPDKPFQIPKEAIESPEGLLFLRNQGLDLPERLVGKIITVPLETLLYCRAQRLQTQIQTPDSLAVSIVSVSRDRKTWFTLTEQGWIPSANRENGEGPAKESEEGTLYEHPDATEALSHLTSFDLAETSQGEWVKPIDFDFASEFSDWIQSLPGTMQIIADDELESLVDNKISSRYALRIEASAHPDWFDVRLEPELLDSRLTYEEQRLLLKANGDFVYLNGKGWRRFQPEVSAVQKDLFSQLGLKSGESTEDALPFHAMQLAETDLEEALPANSARSIRKRAKEITTTTPSELPRGISTTLRPYQEDGFRFLAFLSQNRFGGILADDMGLGKTLQTLTWLTWLKLKHPSEEAFRCLVVCPKSVVHVWLQETQRHSRMLSIGVFDPKSTWRGATEHADTDILVANYSQLRIHGSFFREERWTAAVLDEGQNIKNPQSKTAQTARSIQADNKVVLTGTPVENRVLDLWSLFSFAMPGLLGSQAAFKRQYRETEPDAAQRLYNRVRHFMLRRSKNQVAKDLPDRIEETLACQMEGEQLDLYNAELKLARQRIHNVSAPEDFSKERFNILSSLLRLRQICCHPRLVDPAYADVGSAKLEALLELVDELRDEGHKVLIFSQFVEMLEIVRTELEKRACPHLMLTGKTRNREEIVDRFQTDSGITAFLLSLKAAGAGLNLTAASYVILYDPWWNPAVESQAIDRAHRIGQKDTVNAYRLIARESVEDKIQSLQLKKEMLANEVVQEESLHRILDLDHLKEILAD